MENEWKINGRSMEDEWRMTIIFPNSSAFYLRQEGFFLRAQGR
jgi:hypothetical protein